LRTLTKYQSLNSLLTVNKRFIQLLLFWFHFLDLLIEFMKIRLLYTCTAPPPLPCDGKDLLISSPFYMCPFTGPPPLRGPSRGGGPSRSHVFCRRGERGETGTTPPHAGWRRAQKILVLVTLMPHMQTGQGQNHPLLFCNFFYIVKIIEKRLFYEPEIGFIAKKTYKRRISIFFKFFDT
jgi:hypothetical protein